MGELEGAKGYVLELPVPGHHVTRRRHTDWLRGDVVEAWMGLLLLGDDVGSLCPQLRAPVLLDGWCCQDS